jgi:uncharacterized protein DUF4388
VVEGDLADLPIAGLLTILATDRATAVVRIHNGAEQGALYLRDGILVHARVGRTVGDDAVQHLLAAANGGRFRLVREPVAQPQTVTRSLADFLGPAAAAAPAGGAVATDRSGANAALLAELLELLTRLDQDRASLAEGRVDLNASLPLLSTMVNAMIAFVLSRRRDTGVQPVEVLARMASTQPYAQLFGDDGGRLAIDAVVEAMESEPDFAGERRRMCVSVGDALVDVLSEYCVIVASLFDASAEREEWRITFEVFIADLRSAVQQLDSEGKGDVHGQEMRARGR